MFSWFYLKNVYTMNILNMHIQFIWDDEKNQKLLQERNIWFEEIVDALHNGWYIETLDNIQQEYKHQKLLIIKHIWYIYVIPCVFIWPYICKLITIYPSRKHTRLYF